MSEQESKLDELLELAKEMPDHAKELLKRFQAVKESVDQAKTLYDSKQNTAQGVINTMFPQELNEYDRAVEIMNRERAAKK